MQRHIFVGQVKDVAVFYAAQSQSNLVQWAIPITAKFGDKGVFLLPRVLSDSTKEVAAFVAVGAISSHPRFDNNRWTKWGADVDIVSFDPPFEPVGLPLMQKQMGDWPAIQHPWNRSFPIDLDFELPLINFLKSTQNSSVAVQFARFFS